MIIDAQEYNLGHNFFMNLYINLTCKTMKKCTYNRGQITSQKNIFILVIESNALRDCLDKNPNIVTILEIF